MSFEIIVPTQITDAMLASSSVPEPSPGDGTLWSSTTSYAVDSLVYIQHRRYQAAVANTNRNPLNDVATQTVPAAWVYLGPTNRWAAFDDEIGTITTGSAPLKIVLRPGLTSGLALFEITAASARVTMRDAPGGTIIYQRDLKLDGSIIDSFYDWFFAPYERLRDVVLTDLPGSFAQNELTIELFGADDVSIGVVLPGMTQRIGETQQGASVGIVDYSRVTRDPTFGKVTIQKRAYSKRGTFAIMCDPRNMNRIYRTLADIRSTPCVFIATQDYGYEPLLIYGIYRDFALEVEYLTKHLCSIQVEGMT